MKKSNKGIILILLLCVGFLFTACDFSSLGSLLDDLNDSTKLDDTVRSITISGETRVEAGKSIRLYSAISPAEARQDVSWVSSDENIAVVNNGGVVEGINPGTVNITATSVIDSSVSETVVITVLNSSIDPTSIEVVGEMEIYVGNSSKYSIKTVPQIASTKVNWSSSDTNIATISYDGIVKALKAGKVTITAKYSDSVSDSFEITIKNKTVNPQKISIKGYNYIFVNEVNTLEYTVLPLNAIDTVVWTSSDEDIAIVDSHGRVKGIAPGEVIITATSVVSGTVKKDFKVTIKEEPKIDELNEMTEGEQIKTIINNARKSVFGVINYQFSQATNALEKYSIGTGFVYDAWAILNDGTIVSDPTSVTDLSTINRYGYHLLSNRHVVEKSEMLKLYIGEYDKYIDCTLLQYDDKNDVSVIYFEFIDYIKPMKLGDSSKLETGDKVIAIGNPKSLDFYDSATMGIVSNPLRHYSTDTDGDGVNDWDQAYIQHDAAINPGNSGGPLFNMSGEVVGINTMKFTGDEIDTMGFSIPTNSVIDVLDILEEGRKPQRSVLGVSIIEVKNASNGKIYTSPTTYVEVPRGLNFGLLVTTVDNSGLAHSSGVLPGDIILSIDGVDIHEGFQVRVILGNFIVGSGKTANIEVYRNDKVEVLKAKF